MHKIYCNSIYNTLSNEEYHADPGISRSGLMMYAESPYKYWAHYLNPNRPPKESTKAMDFGSAFHTYVLEPDLFWKEYDIKPTPVLLKDVGRETYNAYKQRCVELESSNKTILSSDEMALLIEMMRALQNHPEAWELIHGAVYEQSYFWRDKESGLMVKARPDILHDNMIVDLKTIVSASTRYYQRVMADSWYHCQGAIIREGVRELTGRDIPNVINICVEKTYPWEIGIKIISEDALEYGRIQFKETLMRMKNSIQNNYWPSYAIETVELPKWY